MTLSVRTAKRSEAELLDTLLQDYLEEFSAFETIDRTEDGRFHYPYLKHYWEDPDRYPFLFRSGDEMAGIALLRFEPDPVNGRGVMDLAEFYVVPPLRRKGLATSAATQLWDLFPGYWQVRVLKSNKNAYPFWRKVITEYTGGAYNEQPPSGAYGGFYTFTFQSRKEADLLDDPDPEMLDF